MKAKTVVPIIKWTCVISVFCIGAAGNLIPHVHLLQTLARADDTTASRKGAPSYMPPSYLVQPCTSFELSPSKGTPADERTRELLRERAKAGEVPAFEKLGLAYYSGALGLKQQYGKAEACFDAAMMQGKNIMYDKCPNWKTEFCPGVSIISMIYLAKLHANGLVGGRKNTELAQALIEQAQQLTFDPALNKELAKEQAVLSQINTANQAKEDAQRHAWNRQNETSAQRITIFFYSNFTADWVCNAWGRCGNRIRLRTPDEQASPDERQAIEDMVLHMQN